MSAPASNPEGQSKMKRLTSASIEGPPYSKLPRSEDPPDVERRSPPPVTQQEPPRRRWQFLPAFWTIASVLSMIVNVILIIILLLLIQMLGQVNMQSVQLTAMDQASGLLGGLYTNFVKMDEAHIRTTIHVEEEIPVQFTLGVSGPTRVTLSEPVTISGVSVYLQTGGLNIRDANATIILPQGTVLPIFIEHLEVPVDQNVPAVLNVPVDIPLNQTELHDPFVGLQEVVRPWYCLIRPQAVVNGIQVCQGVGNPLRVPTVNPTPVDPTLIDPALREPTPVETTIP
jgi:hypothetical protein